MSNVTGLIRIVIVDDDTSFLDELSSLVLTCPELEIVGRAQNGLEAMDRVETLMPDLVIMDVNMPRLDGVETTHAIKVLYPDILVIGLLVNANVSADVTAMQKAGACRVLGKADVVNELCPAIREAITELKPRAKARQHLLSTLRCS